MRSFNKLKAAARVSLISLAILPATLQFALCQSNENIPVPEYYGTYAVVEGRLVKLDSDPFRPEKTVNARFGQRNGVGNILQGQPVVAASTAAAIAKFTPDFTIIVFSQPSGMQSPLDVAKSLRIEPLVFVRNLTVDTGWPNKVRRSGAENGWDSGEAPELLGVASGDRSKAMEFLVKPMPGHQDMVIAVPSQPLAPGVYKLSEGEGSPFSRAGGIHFAVEPISDGEASKCVDAFVTYAMSMSNAKYAPCGGSPLGSGSTSQQTATVQSANATPAVAASCTEYDGCMSAGQAAFRSKDFQGAISDFQAASVQRPSGGDAWAWLGISYLAAGRERDTPAAWDKALQLGATLPISVCHGRGMLPCDAGHIHMDASEISFTANNAKQFAVPPSQVSVLGASNNPFKSQVSFGLRISEKNYSYDFFPYGTACRVGGFLHCSEDGSRQQIVVRDYVLNTIPKLVAGTFGHPSQPASSPSAASSSSNNTACNQAVDAGYSLLLQGHLYKVKTTGPAGPNQLHLFFDDKGAQVIDTDRLSHLATAAWTWENAVADARTGSRRVSAILDTSVAIQQYSHVQGALATAMTEAIKLYATQGASALKITLDLTLDQLKSQIQSAPKIFLMLTAQKGLRESLQEYRQMEPKFPPADSTTLDASVLEDIYRSYLVARILELPYGALAAKLMPISGGDLGKEAINMIASGLLSSLPGGSVGRKLTLQTLLDVNETLGTLNGSIPALKPYAENLDLALKLAAANKRTISTWTAEASYTCGQADKTPPAPDTKETVLATFEYDGSHYLLIPFLRYDGQSYVQLYDGLDAPGIGQAKPNTPDAAAAIKRSLLNRVKDFDVYHSGKLVGHFSISGISVVVFDTFTKVAGSGIATGFEPKDGYIAVAGPAGHEGFWPSRIVTTAQKTLLRVAAMGLFPKSMPKIQSMPKYSGRPLVFGKPSDSSTAIALTKGGSTNVWTELKVPILSPGEHSNQFSAEAYILGPLPTETAAAKPVFSSAGIRSDESEVYGQGSFELLDVLDIDGDGSAEILLLHGQGESGDIEVFSFRDGSFHKLLSIGWTGS